jgi:hypothetical protein
MRRAPLGPYRHRQRTPTPVMRKRAQRCGVARAWCLEVVTGGTTRLSTCTCSIVTGRAVGAFDARCSNGLAGGPNALPVFGTGGRASRGPHPPACAVPRWQGDRVQRRSLVAVLAAAHWGTPSRVGAQPAGRIHRLGLLHPDAPGVSGGLDVPTFLTAPMRDLGYVEGRNLIVEKRYAHGKFDLLPGLARELVGIPVDVIVAVSTSAALAAKAATKIIPIVFLAMATQWRRRSCPVLRTRSATSPAL